MKETKNTVMEYVIRSIDREISCTLFRRDCKRLRISITRDLKVNIVAPLRATDAFIHEAVREKTPWILKSLKRFKQCMVLPLPEKYETGEKLTYLGDEYMLRVIEGKRAPVMISGDTLTVQLPKPDMKGIKRAIDRWFLIQAEMIFSRCLTAGYSIVSRYVSAEPLLKIRKMKSRWGSCSRAGKITLNLRLIHLPEVCIEYIVMHELCHLKNLNHSKAFYSFLQVCMPDWKDRKAILESYRLSD